MKRILSVLLALVMIVGMIPMSILSASAATAGESVTYTFSDYTAGTQYAQGEEHILDETVSLIINGAHLNSQVRLYAGSNAVLNSELPITSVTLKAGNKVNTLNVYTSTDGTSFTLAEAVSVTSTSYKEYTVDVDDATVAVKMESPSDGAQIRVSAVTMTFGEAPAGACTHTNTTATTVEPNCTEAGSITTVCDSCGKTISIESIPTTGHTYENGSCTACGEAAPADLSGKYYIAAKRTADGSAYYYMTSDLGTANTKRYTAVDSGLAELPDKITTPNDSYVFEFIGNDSTGLYTICADGVENGYLSWTSGNSGALVAADSAKNLTVEATESGSYNIYFTNGTEERYLSLNNTSGSDYFAFYIGTQVNDLYLIPVVQSGEVEPDPEEPACTHANTTTNTVAASCGVAGSETVVCNDCGETVSTTVIEATGHNYVDGTCANCGAAEVIQPAASSATIDFSTTDQRVSQDTSSQVWQNNGLTVTNDKASSTTDIADYSNPVRFYKGSTVTVAYTGMTKIVFNCNTASYATALANSISGATVSVSEKVVTVVLNAAADTFTTGGMSAQVRVDSITVTASTCEHVWGEMVQTSAPTCTETGVNTSTCTLCGETKTETVPATGHTYTYVDGTMTCSCGDVTAISTIAAAKDYTSTSQVYYIKGIVTYVSGKNVYIEDATGAICVYFATAPSDIALGDEIVVWDTMTAYNGLIETTNTTELEYLKVSSGNALPSQTVTIADLTADTTKEYLGERVVIENVTIGVLGTNNTALTAADGSTINIYKAPALSEDINENDTVTVTAIVSTFNGYQLLINPGTAATDVVETAAGEEEIVTTVTVAEAKAGTAGEYYQVEGTVTYVSGRNVYIQDATGGIVVYLTANAATTQVGDNVKAYGALKNYNGLLELDAVDETNANFYTILSSGNTVDAQQVSIAGLLADTNNEYLAEKVALYGVYVSYVNYSSSYGNVTYKLYDSNGNFIEIYRMTVASEEEVVAVGSQINVEAIVSSYNGYQLVTSSDKITVTGTCEHEITELVNVSDATCTEAGYTGDTMCTTCGYYTVKGAATEALGHSFTENGTCENGCSTKAVIVMNNVYYTSFNEANAAYDGHPMKLLANIGENGAVLLTQTIYIDLNGFFMYANASTANCTVYGMDSSTDSYEAEEWGVLNVTGATVAPVTNSYLAVDEGENNWSFHAFSVKLTHVSLDPTNDALGYKAQFFGDEMVLAKVTGFGFNMWVHEEKVVSKSVDAVTNGQIVTLRLYDIMASNGGQLVINAEAFVTFEGVENAVESNTHQTTMKNTVEAIELDLEDGATELTAAQIKSVQGLITKFESKMVGWNIDAIKAWDTTNA